jgi:hypothetical protein
VSVSGQASCSILNGSQSHQANLHVDGSGTGERRHPKVDQDQISQIRLLDASPPAPGQIC